MSLTIEPITKELRKKNPTMSDELNIFERLPPMMQEHEACRIPGVVTLTLVLVRHWF